MSGELWPDRRGQNCTPGGITYLRYARYAKSGLTLQDLYYVDGCFTSGAVIKDSHSYQSCCSSELTKPEIVLSSI